MHDYFIFSTTIRAFNGLKHIKVMDSTIIFCFTCVIKVIPLDILCSNIEQLVALSTLYLINNLSSHIIN